MKSNSTNNIANNTNNTIKKTQNQTENDNKIPTDREKPFNNIPSKIYQKDFNPKSYILFSDLANFSENEDFIELIKKINLLIKISDNWNNNMEAINILRRLNKFKKNFFNTNFDAHFKYLSNYLNSPRSCLVKITLMLISEIFSESNSHIKFPDWIENLIPIVIKKNVLDKNFIQEEAKICLGNFTRNIHSTEALLIFLKILQDKNLKYSTKAYELFIELVQNFDNEKIGNLQLIKFEAIFKELIEISKIKKDPIAKRLKIIFIALLRKIGIEKMEKMLNDMLNLEDYLYFTKTDMICFNDICNKIILEEKGILKDNKNKNKISLQEHIKSLKNSESLNKENYSEKEKASNTDNIEVKITLGDPKDLKDSKIPILVLKSSKKVKIDEETLNRYSEQKIKEVKKEFKEMNIIEENPLKNYKILSKTKSNGKKSNTASKKILENFNENEEREKGSIDIEMIKKSVKKSSKKSLMENDDKENIVNN